MKPINTLEPRWRAGLSLAVLITAISAASLASAAAADAATDAAPPAKASKTAEKKQLTGADLYAMNCNRCHPERYATERTAAQWKTIMLHMRVRANLPADQAKTILKYLQEDSGK
jgi:anti-sigma factor RsiW